MASTPAAQAGAPFLAIGMYGGFEVTVLFREEVGDPVRIIPRARFAVIAIAMTIYALPSLMFANSLCINKVVGLAQADPTGAMNTSIETFGGTLLFDLATVMVITSTFAVILAAHNIAARYVFNLSADKVLPTTMSAVHKRHGSPHVASVATSYRSAWSGPSGLLHRSGWDDQHDRAAYNFHLQRCCLLLYAP
jgi:amino acid transporter